MRALSPSRAKGTGTNFPRDAPTEGTKLREVYDLLMCRRGIPVEIPFDCLKRGWMIRQLTDFYGLDIRKIDQKNQSKPHEYVLAGEWCGREYVDYIALRMAQRDEAMS